MKKMILALLFSLGGSAQAANIPQASSVSIGGSPVTSSVSQSGFIMPLSSAADYGAASGIYTFCGGFGTGVSGNYYGLYSMKSPLYNGGSTTPTGKTFYLTNVSIFSNTAPQTFQLLHSTGTLPLGDNTSTAPPGAIYLGNSASGGAVSSGFITEISGRYNSFPGQGISLPGGVYLSFRVVAGAVTQHMCITGLAQ